MSRNIYDPTKHKKFNKSSRATSAKSREVKCFRYNGSNHIAAECKHSWVHIGPKTNEMTTKVGKGITPRTRHQNTKKQSSGIELEKLEESEDKGPNDDNNFSSFSVMITDNHVLV